MSRTQKTRIQKGRHPMLVYLYKSVKNIRSLKFLYVYLYLVIIHISILSAAPKTVYTSVHFNAGTFYNALGNVSSINSIQFNTSGQYEFDQNHNIKASSKNRDFNFIFKRSNQLMNKLVIKNLQLSGYDEIRIYLRHRVQLEFENCIFQFEGNTGIIIYFDNEYLAYGLSDTSSYITFENCKFINIGEKISDGSSYQLKFVKDRYPNEKDGIFSIKNIRIFRTKFVLENYPDNLSKSFNSISIKRTNETDYVKNIDIRENRFEFRNANNAHTGGIIIENANPGCNYSIANENNYIKNKIINIEGNILKTDSAKPGQGIFIQGPYDSINVNNNIVSGFSGIIQNKKLASPDGDIHLYGARGSAKYYSDDNRNMNVTQNIVYSRGTGIRMSGGQNFILENNIIHMLPLPSFWQKDHKGKFTLTGRFGISVGTGNTEDSQKQAGNFQINKNRISGNLNSTNKTEITENCGGIILFSPRDFSIKHNMISTNNYGIVYFKHGSQKEQSFGISDIRNNVIDYGNQTSVGLKSTFYSRYNKPFSGINVQRKFNDSQKIVNVEQLTIEGNIVISSNDEEIVPVVFDHGSRERISNNCKYIVR